MNHGDYDTGVVGFQPPHWDKIARPDNPTQHTIGRIKASKTKMTGSDPTSPESPKRMIWALFIALVVWGLYLAIGATGAFTDINLFDIRKSLIVLGCSAGFLGFWVFFLVVRRRGTFDSTSRVISISSVLSLALTSVGFALWAVARWTWNDDGIGPAVTMGWLSVTAFAVAAISALVGISDPQPRRAKLSALITLGLLAVAAVAFVIQVLNHG